MKATDFYSLPEEGLLVAAKEAQNCAKSHYDVAVLAASQGQYAIATSLMILSVEECIKTSILAAGYFEVALPFDIEPFFKSHNKKHEQAAHIQPVVNFVWKIKDEFVPMLKDKKSPYQLVFKLAIEYILASLGFSSLTSDGRTHDFIEWWKKANTQKNEGFYVGYSNSKWHFPAKTDERVYLEALSMARPFVETLQLIHKIQPGDKRLVIEARKISLGGLEGPNI